MSQQEKPQIIDRSWMESGNKFSFVDSSVKIIKELPKAIYSAKFNSMTNEFYLEKLDDKFTFDGKLYGLEDKFIGHVLKTFENTTQNLGILLNGSKGTGKTVCAKVIANEMNLPVILCDIPIKELAIFISHFNIPAIFFFDEFEKNFRDKTDILLSVMDGAYNTPVRKVFILTTNNLYINENFLSRPSRIRYTKTFGNLSRELVLDYCNDNLIDKSRTEEIAAFIDTLSISTIDILRSLVQEVNMHNCSISEFKDFFNVKAAPYQYNIIFVEANNMYSIDEFTKEVNLYIEHNGYQSAEDVVDDEDDEKKEESDVKKKYKNLLRYTNKRNTFTTAKVSCGKSARYLTEGDTFYHGVVMKPLNEDNILVIENNHGYGKPYIFAKIMDIEAKPSLYYSASSCIF